MVNDILKKAGIQYRESRFPKPPTGTYAVYSENLITDGPDLLNMLISHDVIIELYEPDMDTASESAVESQMNAAKVRWTKQPRYWIQDVQRYQVIYECAYVEKGRGQNV